MVMQHTEKHPNELLGITVDEPRAEPRALLANAPRYRVACYIAATGTFVGWLNSYENWCDLTGSENQPEGVIVSWLADGALYLAWVNGTNRYMACSNNGWAGWYLWNGAQGLQFNKTGENPLQGTICLGTTGCLHPAGNDYIAFGNTNTTLLCKFFPV